MSNHFSPIRRTPAGGKNSAHAPKTAGTGFCAAETHCSALQRKFLAGAELNLHPNRVPAMEVAS